MNAEDWLGDVDEEELKTKKKLAIVMAGENLDSPASMFGHTFLVAYNGDLPEPDDIVVEYLADTSSNEYNPVSALILKVPGRFTFSRYFYKYKQNDLENRDLVFYEVDMKKVDMEKIIQKIKESKTKSDSYNFITRNCSYYVFRLLINDDSNPLITIPIRSIDQLKQKSIIKYTRYIVSTQKLLEYSFKNLSETEKDTIDNVLNGHSCGESCNTNANLKNILGLALNYQIPREYSLEIRKHLNQEKKKYPYSEKELKTNIPENQTDPSANLKISSLQLLYNNNNSLLFTFTPAYKSIFFVNNQPIGTSQVESLRTQMAIFKDKVKITEFNLFRMEAMIAGGHFSKGIVRYVDFSYYDWSVFHKGKNEAVARVGFGYTKKIFESLQITAMPYLGGRVYDMPKERVAAFDSGMRFYLHQSIYDLFHIKIIYNYDFSNVLGFNQRLSLESMIMNDSPLNLVCNMTIVNDKEKSKSINLGLSFFF
ncbi:DUF4105 domain-containing protein [Leptospira idonii]|uniref:DUF4105 domain-containing protein n=1 Tax=Leptospira idonii TaxID=1193500 RepID=A0A4R9M4F5_9LEPT|nr:DUF4105 domain-containing protein [Leptospira idonii]